MTFTVAIVGRPNVGKSTLFNRLVGKKLALVDDQPGVTRDRREGAAKLGDLEFTIIDTAGLEESSEASLTGRMRLQTVAAIDDADLVLFLIDARQGLTPSDGYFADLVRRSGKPVVLVANKAEGKQGLANALEAYDLGFGDPIPLSAEHGEGLADLYDQLVAHIEGGEGPQEELEDEDADKPLRIAVLGRPNAGKSTLINTLLGEERLLTGPEAGITRDSIGIDLNWRGKALKIFDTAGLRKRANIHDKLEKLAAADGLRAARFAEVVIVLLDATIPFEKQDLTIIDLVEKEGRALVVGLNKWDLIDNKGAHLSLMREEFERLMPQVRGAPLIALSGETGQGLDRLMEAVVKAAEVWSRRVSTGQLNRWLESVLTQHTPPAVSGRRIKIRYATQAKTRPPHFTLFGNQLDALPTSYSRYLVNSLREAFDLPGVPIRLSLRNSKNPFDKSS